MKNKHLAFTAVTAMILLLAGCGSSGIGDIFGGPQSQPSTYPNASATDIYGTVNYVDTRNQQIELNVNDYNGQRTQTVAYDSRTRVTYQGQSGSPSQLERGDQVSVRMADNGNGRVVADTITVTQSVQQSSSSTYPGTYPSNPSGSYPSSSTGRVTGTVNYVDTQARLIQLNASYVTGLRNSTNNTFTIYYDSRTRVMYQGREFSPADLERGDQVDVTTFMNGNHYMADTITVTRNVRQ